MLNAKDFGAANARPATATALPVPVQNAANRAQLYAHTPLKTSPPRARESRDFRFRGANAASGGVPRACSQVRLPEGSVLAAGNWPGWEWPGRREGGGDFVSVRARMELLASGWASSRVGVGDQLPFQSKPPIKLPNLWKVEVFSQRPTVTRWLSLWPVLGTAKVLPKLQLLCNSVGRCGTSITVTFLQPLQSTQTYRKFVLLTSDSSKTGYTSLNPSVIV